MMEFVRGRNLWERLRLNGRSRESEAPPMRRRRAGKEETWESGKEETRGAAGLTAER
jgi:hypothetical protein